MPFDTRPLKIERPSKNGGGGVRTRDSHSVIAAHAVKENVQHRDPSVVTKAFGRRAAFLYTENLSSDDVQFLCDTLRVLEDFFIGHPKNVWEAVDAAMIPSLNNLLHHSDPQVRTRAAYILSLVATVEKGRRGMLDANTIPQLLSRLLPDGVVEVRANVIEALHAATVFDEAVVLCVIENKGVEQIVRDVQNSAHPRLLETLYVLIGIEKGRDAALAAGGIEVATSLMSVGHFPPNVLDLAAQNLQRLCIPFEAKKKALEVGSVAAIGTLLRHENDEVRQAACSALMVICIDIDAKKQAVKIGIPNRVIMMLEEESPGAQLVAVKAISVLAEADRSYFVTCVSKLQQIAEESRDDVLKRAAERAVEVIRWEP